MIKKVLITSALVASVAANAYAAEKSDYAPTLTLGGVLDAQAGYVRNKDDFKYVNPANTNTSSKLSNHAIVNDTKLILKIKGNADAFEYGGLIKLYADTSESKEFSLNANQSSKQAEQTMAYIKGMFGLVQVGNYVGVTDTMKVGASSFASATGGIDGDTKFWTNTNSPNNWDSSSTRNLNANNLWFLTSPNLPTDDLGTTGVQGKNAGKISYYTPSFSGFMAGISYTPDIQVYGTIAEAKAVTQTINSSSEFYNNRLPVFKNIVSGGLYYEGLFDQLGVKASLIGEMANAKKVNNSGNLNKRNRKLKAWQGGLNLSYMGFTVGGSYGDWGKSMLGVNSDAKSTKYYTLGAGYEYGPFSTSLTYMATKRGVVADIKRNKYELVSLGLDYKLAPGLMPYAEVSWFKNKNHVVDNSKTPAAPYPSNKGTVFLLGSKLQF